VAIRPFDSLTARGKRLRVRGLARVAAARYGLDSARITPAGESFNTVFRLRSDDGGDYALRVGAARNIHPSGSAEVEAAWMGALARDTKIPVGPVVRNRDHGVVTEVETPGVPEPRRCVLFRWVPGPMLVDHLDLATAGQSGRLLAELHAHGNGQPAPAPGSVAVADRVLYWNVPVQLGSVAARHGTLFTDAADRAQATIDDLWAAPPHRPHLLHGDLTPVNTVKTRHGLAPIDFQDLVWGFEVQDVAISLLPYQRKEAVAALTEMFRAGYESIRPWPEFDARMLDALFAARRLHMLNLSLNMRPPHLDASIERVAAWLTTWMRSVSPPTRP
jgi:Ser/Thr protein kinase RdoA (MazF antagonist)